MFSLFLLLWLGLLGDETIHMPPPTKEIQQLIKQLGDDSWRIREKADSDLRKIGWPALQGVYCAGIYGEDLETRVRSIRIYRSYFNISSDDPETRMPSIWFLDEKLRYPKGYELEKAKIDRLGSVCKILDVPDVAKEFYEKAVKRNNADLNDYKNEDFEREAMWLYMKQRLLRGEKHADLKKLLNQAVKNSKEYLHYYQTANIDQEWPAYDWYNSPPGPMIKKEDFKEPNGWGP
jgi:hypothetical protein